MKIEMRKLSEMAPDESNPRINAVDAKSIREFRQPIVVDEQGVIVIGNNRFEAAQNLGMLESPGSGEANGTPERGPGAEKKSERRRR